MFAQSQLDVAVLSWNDILKVHIQVFQGSSKTQELTYFQDIYFKGRTSPECSADQSFSDNYAGLYICFSGLNLAGRNRFWLENETKQNVHLILKLSIAVDTFKFLHSSALSLRSRHPRRAVLGPSRRLSARVQRDTPSHAEPNFRLSVRHIGRPTELPSQAQASGKNC